MCMFPHLLAPLTCRYSISHHRRSIALTQHGGLGAWRITGPMGKNNVRPFCGRPHDCNLMYQISDGIYNVGKQVKSVIKTLSTEGPKKNLKKFTSFFTRCTCIANWPCFYSLTLATRLQERNWPPEPTLASFSDSTSKFPGVPT